MLLWNHVKNLKDKKIIETRTNWIFRDFDKTLLWQNVILTISRRGILEIFGRRDLRNICGNKNEGQWLNKGLGQKSGKRQ